MSENDLAMQLARMQQTIEQQQQQQQQPQPGQMQHQFTAPGHPFNNFGVVHSLPTRPKYDWAPSADHIELMDLGQDLFRSTPLEDKERKLLIESYPPIDGLNYQPPEAIPSAYTAMSDYQWSHDGSLKSS